MTADEKRSGKKRIGKASKPVTPQSLERSALHYLERFSASTASLRRVLIGKLRRAAEFSQEEGPQGASLEEGKAWIEALILRFTQAGYLDDDAYAAQKARSLLRRGRSVSAIRQTLAQKGVDASLTEQALDSLCEEESPEADRHSLDLTAAIALARRRRLGPFRSEAQRADLRAKDLATLGRAGFSFDLARRVVDAPSVESLTEEG